MNAMYGHSRRGRAERELSVEIMSCLLYARCHLSSGKMVWLCTKHQKQDGVAVLSDKVADVNTTLQEAGIDNTAFKDLMSTANERAGKGDCARPVTANTPRSGGGSASSRTKRTGSKYYFRSYFGQVPMALNSL